MSVVVVGTLKVWNTCETVVQTNVPWIHLGIVCLHAHS